MRREEEPPREAEHLRLLGGRARWVPSLSALGFTLLIAVAVLTVTAPNVLWLLAYPALIVAALWALVNAAAFLLRKF